jgi:hypothetical protein
LLSHYNGVFSHSRSACWVLSSYYNIKLRMHCKIS